MSLVDSFTHLTGRPKSDHALPLLQRIASLVKPVMRKRCWRLPVLSEFFPDEPSLLGLNMNSGQKILLRLRPPWSLDTFYDEEQLVSVMLHELTHNVHGPHDEKFYKYLSELEAEYDSLRSSGYDGEGFHSAGKRLGVGVSHNLPPHLTRAKALQAAEKRKAQQKLFGSPGGQRLGGRPPRGILSMSPRELAVQAAERRARDEKACGTTKEIAQREAEKAAKESVEDKASALEAAQGIPDHGYINGDLAPRPANREEQRAYDPSTGAGWPCSVCTLDNPPSASQCLACLSTRPRPSRQDIPHSRIEASSASTSRIASNATSSLDNGSLMSSSSLKKKEHDVKEPGWNCPSCTLHNPDHFLQCSVCLYVRPQSVLKDGWTCIACGEGGIPHEFWSCRFCGRIKDRSAAA